MVFTYGLLDKYFWVEQRKLWPKPTAGFMFLGDALHEVGKARYGEVWTGYEPVNSYIPLLGESEDAAAARERLRWVMDWLATNGRESAFATALMPIKGGLLTTIEPGFWSGPGGWAADRFFACRADSGDPYARSKREGLSLGDSFIFIEAERFGRCLAQVVAERLAATTQEGSDGSKLIARLPDNFAPGDVGPFMGLAEAIAWVGSRDNEFTAAARWHSLDRPEINAEWIAAAYFDLQRDLDSVYGKPMLAVVTELFGRCAIGEIEGKGRQGDGFRPIGPDDWIEAKPVYEREPDTIALAGRHNGIHSPRWTHVRFNRADILKIWPHLCDNASSLGWPAWLPSAYPFTPTDYAYFAEAGETIGRIIHGEHAASPFLSDDDEALERRTKLVEMLHLMLADGTLQGAISDPHTRMIIPIRQNVWNCSPALAEERIRTCQFDLSNPFSMPGANKPHAPVMCQLFVERGTLDVAVSHLRPIVLAHHASASDGASRADEPTAISAHEPSKVGNLDDLDALLSEPVKPYATKPTYQRQTKEPIERQMLATFLQKADDMKMLMGQENHKSSDYLHERYRKWCLERYEKWCMEQGVITPRVPVKPLEISAFKKWAKQYRSGDWGRRSEPSASRN